MIPFLDNGKGNMENGKRTILDGEGKVLNVKGKYKKQTECYTYNITRNM